MYYILFEIPPPPQSLLHFFSFSSFIPKISRKNKQIITKCVKFCFFFFLSYWNLINFPFCFLLLKLEMISSKWSYSYSSSNKRMNGHQTHTHLWICSFSLHIRIPKPNWTFKRKYRKKEWIQGQRRICPNVRKGIQDVQKICFLTTCRDIVVIFFLFFLNFIMFFSSSSFLLLFWIERITRFV